MTPPTGNKNDRSNRKEGLLAKAARANTQFRQQTLRKIRRARTRLLVCFWTLPVYVVAVWILLNNGRDIDTIMWIYMGLYAIFAVDMASRRCPRCNNQFFVKTIVLNLITHRCVHCDLALDGSDPDDTSQSEHDSGSENSSGKS